MTSKGAAKVLDTLPRVIESYRVGPYNWDDLKASFSDCTEDSFYIYMELRQTKNPDDRASVFERTATAEFENADRVTTLFNKAYIDGMINGLLSDIYSNYKNTRAAA